MAFGRPGVLHGALDECGHDLVEVAIDELGRADRTFAQRVATALAPRGGGEPQLAQEPGLGEGGRARRGLQRPEDLLHAVGQPRRPVAIGLDTGAQVGQRELVWRRDVVLGERNQLEGVLGVRACELAESANQRGRCLIEEVRGRSIARPGR